VNRRRRNVPKLGEWKPSAESGWQHGKVPEPPDGLMADSLTAWTTWFRSWFASHWAPEDVPGLLLVIRMYDDVLRGSQSKASDRASLHAWMRSYGITPDGQQKLRWLPPKTDEVPSSPSQSTKPRRKAAAASDVASPYAHLRVVNR